MKAALRAIAASVAKLQSSKLVFHAEGGGPESVQSASRILIKERYGPLATNGIETNMGQISSWRSKREPVMNLQSLKSCAGTARGFSTSPVNFFDSEV